MTVVPSMTIKSIAAAVVLLVASAAAANQLEGRPILTLTVTGLHHIDETVVTAQIETRPGRLYAQSIADKDILRLEQLRVFSSISITPIEAGEGVRVEVRVVESPRMLPAVSFSLTDESGAAIGPAVEVLSIHGHPLDVTALSQFGGQTLVGVSEVSPLLTDRPLWHSVSLSLRDRTNRLEDFHERSVDLDARIGVRGSEAWKTGAIVQLYGVGSDVSGATLSADNHDMFFGVGGVFDYDSRDSLTTTTRGWWNTADAIWHGGSGTFATLDLDLRRYQPIASRHIVVATGLLTLQSGEPGVDLPTYTDYAIGGENSVRGWEFASRRGKNQAIASLEYRYMAVPTRTLRFGRFGFYLGLALAAFGDAGSAWSKPEDFSNHVISGGGVGLRLFVPYVDVIRLDVSFGSALSVDLGLGEKAVAQRNRVR